MVRDEILRGSKQRRLTVRRKKKVLQKQRHLQYVPAGECSEKIEQPQAKLGKTIAEIEAEEESMILDFDAPILRMLPGEMAELQITKNASGKSADLIKSVPVEIVASSFPGTLSCSYQIAVDGIIVRTLERNIWWQYFWFKKSKKVRK